MRQIHQQKFSKIRGFYQPIILRQALHIKWSITGVLAGSMYEGTFAQETFWRERLKLNVSETSHNWGSGYLLRIVFRIMQFRLSENAFLVNYLPLNGEEHCHQP